jgi:hypothetical protein
MNQTFWPKIFSGFIFGFGLVFSQSPFAKGGPPLITDDPGTPGDGRWEFNIATQIDPNGENTVYQIPQIDANYGLAVGYEIEKDRELLAEVHARCPIGEGLELLPEIGTRYAFSEAMSFIAAFGHTTETPIDVPAFWNIYFGLQLRM